MGKLIHMILVHLINRAWFTFMKVIEVASPVLKAPGECDFSLHVGTSIDGNPIIWNNRNNGHICVTGNTGVGKTFFLKKLIAQLPEHNARCVIFDVESDFSKTGEGSPDDWNTLSFDILEWEKEQIDPIPFYPIIALNMISHRNVNE